jgi:hypothetical protein
LLTFNSVRLQKELGLKDISQPTTVELQQ